MLGKLMNKHLNGKLVNKFFERLSRTNPKILFAGGIVGIVTTLFVSYKKAPLIKDAIEQMDEEIKEYNSLIEEGYGDAQKPDLQKHVTSILKHSTLPVLCALLTIGMFTASNQVMAKRLAVATSGYAAISKEYTDYREEIKSLYGQDADRKAYQATQYKQVEENQVLEEGEKAYRLGDKTVVRKTYEGLTSVMVTDLYSGIEPEAADEDFGRKYMLLKKQFEDQGYLLMNQVRDLFNVPRIPEGHYLGWAWGDRFELEWTPMPPANVVTGELLYDPDVYFVCDYELAWTIPMDITDEIQLGKIQA